MYLPTRTIKVILGLISVVSIGVGFAAMSVVVNFSGTATPGASIFIQPFQTAAFSTCPQSADNGYSASSPQSVSMTIVQGNAQSWHTCVANRGSGSANPKITVSSQTNIVSGTCPSDPSTLSPPSSIILQSPSSLPSIPPSGVSSDVSVTVCAGPCASGSFSFTLTITAN